MVIGSLTCEVTMFKSSWTFEFANPSMKSINDPVSFKAIKHAGRRIFIIISIKRLGTIEAEKEMLVSYLTNIII